MRLKGWRLYVGLAQQRDSSLPSLGTHPSGSPSICSAETEGSGADYPFWPTQYWFPMVMRWAQTAPMVFP